MMKLMVFCMWPGICAFQTSVFTPAHGSVTNVTITSLDPAPEVIKSLLEKFKVRLNAILPYTCRYLCLCVLIYVYLY